MRWAAWIRRSSRALLLGAALVALHAAPARAGEPAPEAVQRARDAYDRGKAAYERGDYAAAARALADADAVVPDLVTLRAALDAAVLADDPALGASLLERAEDRPADAPLVDSLRAARARFAGRTGKVRVTCPGAPCAATLDGEPVETGRARFAAVGRHAIAARRGDQTARRDVDVKPGELAEVVLDPAPPRPAAPARGAPAGAPPVEDADLSPAWFFVALGAAALAGGAAVASGADTAGRHDDFLQAGCSGPVHGDCAALADDGSAAQARTNALLAVAGALGAATVVLGVITLGGRGADRPAIALSARGGAAIASLRVPLP